MAKEMTKFNSSAPRNCDVISNYTNTFFFGVEEKATLLVPEAKLGRACLQTGKCRMSEETLSHFWIPFLRTYQH